MKIRQVLLHLLTVTAIVVTAKLGFWQLSRATEKQAIQQQLEIQQQRPMLMTNELVSNLNAIQTEPHKFVHRKVQLRGTWLDQHTVFLDNRQMDKKQGWLVITPFVLDDELPGSSKATIVVQRGWIPRDFLNREQLPHINTDPAQVVLLGQLAPAPSRLFEFEKPSSTKIRQNISLDTFGLEIKRPLLAVTLLQTTPAIQGIDDPQLLRNWPSIVSGVDKHHGYAFQWFLLTTLIVILWIWFNFLASRSRHLRLTSAD